MFCEVSWKNNNKMLDTQLKWRTSRGGYSMSI